MNFNPNVPPPNGYVFRDADGTLLKGTSWKALERRVIEYRKQIGGSVDNVREEILRQVCATTPEFCKPEGPRAEARMGETQKAKIIRYLGMIAAARQAGHLRYCSDSEAAGRVKKCLGCPHRAHVDIGCQSCQNSIAALRKQCLGDKAMRAPALGLCELSKCDLPVAVHVCENKEPDGRMPDFCWRKQK